MSANRRKRPTDGAAITNWFRSSVQSDDSEKQQKPHNYTLAAAEGTVNQPEAEPHISQAKRMKQRATGFNQDWVKDFPWVQERDGGMYALDYKWLHY